MSNFWSPTTLAKSFFHQIFRKQQNIGYFWVLFILLISVNIVCWTQQFQITKSSILKPFSQVSTHTDTLKMIP